MSEIKIIIPDIPPSYNQFAGRKNCWEYRQEKTRWKQLVWACSKRQPAPFRRAGVEITYFFPTPHRRDPDNYAGKFILDGLTAAGIIADDSFAKIRLVLSGNVDKNKPRTEIVIKPEEEG